MSRIPLNVDVYEGNGNGESSSTELARFIVLYGKTSTRKHKIWEGDGILICYNDFCLLKSEDDRDIISRSSAIKNIDDVESGRIIVLGSWTIQVQESLPIKNCATKKTNEEASSKCAQPAKIPLKEQRKRPINSFSSPIQPLAKRGFVSPLVDRKDDAVKTPLFILNEEEFKKKLASAICVDTRFVRVLRDHQKEGIRFIYERLKNVSGGAILADDMGLGKTLQTMASTWALMRGAKNNRNICSKCLIVVPSSLVNNWKAEFKKWWRNMLFPAIVVKSAKDIELYQTLAKSHPYIIISYDMALRYCEKLNETRCDIIVCDEGHKLKNRDGKLRKALMALNIPRRLILTGTPMQNDYEEFYSLLDFIMPNGFGTVQEFLKMCAEEPQRLNELVDTCLLRRTSEINKSHLPEKHEYILFCQASELQKKIHESICNYMTGDSLSLIFFARQLANHPKLLYENLREKHEQGNRKHSSILLEFSSQRPPSGGVSESGKLNVLSSMLKCFTLLNECVVVVSNFIETLDMIEALCEFLQYRVFRLDGSTNVQDRQKLVASFNECHDPRNVFLLSTKAGGVGLNLVGASRLILFDSDWNPANDLQATARIWRDGQVRPCHIYRLVTTGTIEEKILQRQIKKTGLGCVIDAMDIGESVSKFTDDEITDIFTYIDETECNTHDLCRCKCDGTGLLENEMDDSDQEDFDDEEEEEDEEEIDQQLEHVENENVVNNVAYKEDDTEDIKASLAELSRWRHFSPKHDESWKHFIINCGLSQSDVGLKNLSFAFQLSSMF